MKFDLAISSTAVAKRLGTSVGRIDFPWRFRWFCRTHLALQTPRNTIVIGKVFTSMYALVWWPCEGCIVTSFWGTFLGSFWWSTWRSFQPFHFSYWEHNIERSALEINTGSDRLKSPIHFLIIIWPPGAWAACDVSIGSVSGLTTKSRGRCALRDSSVCPR